MILRWFEREDLLERDNFAFTKFGCELAALLVASQLGVDLQGLENRLHLIAGAGFVTERGRCEEALELIEVVLRPTIEGMLVTLSALNADAHERVGESDHAFFRQAEVAACPEVGHGIAIGKVAFGIGPVQFAHAFCVFGVAFALVPAVA